MIRSPTVHNTPEENGVTEQLNCTLLEHAKAMLLTAQLPKNIWPETIHPAVWLKNRMSRWVLNGKTPYEAMHKVKLNLADLPDWGTRVFMMKTNAGKLDNKKTVGRIYASNPWFKSKILQCHFTPFKSIVRMLKQLEKYFLYFFCIFTDISYCAIMISIHYLLYEG